MLPNCIKCRKNTENRRIMLLSKCAVCDHKKSTFIKWLVDYQII